MVIVFLSIAFVSNVLLFLLALWVKISAEDILKYFYLFFSENRIWRFMQIVFLGDNLHGVSRSIF